ncbi:MAG: thiamine pyrophosphate-binding protein [Chloroflexota bacterium]
MAVMTGGELIVRTLASAGVDTVFGIISVHNIPMYDAMKRTGLIRPVPVRHEQAALLMADGYSRATGKLGVALTSTGGGAANGLVGMIESWWSSSSVLHIAGDADNRFIDQNKGFLHEMKDQLGMLRSAAKWADRPGTGGDIPAKLGEAIRQAMSGRPRPVALDTPINLQYFEEDFEVPVFEGFGRVTPSADDVARAADVIRTAKRPLIWAGGGVVIADAGAELTALAEKLGAGVVTSLTGRGPMPEDHELCIGALTLETPVNDLMKEADVLIAVGTRFIGGDTRNWTVELPDTIVHLDVDDEELGRNYPVTVGVQTDARLGLAALLQALDGVSNTQPGWRERCVQVRTVARAGVRDRVKPYDGIMDAIRSNCPRDTVMVRDATVPAYTWGNRLLEIYKNRTSIHSASGAIGIGLPTANGAAVGSPGRRVILMAGDGGFMYNLGELATAVQEKLDVVILLFNDGGYGILRNIQDQQFEGRRTAVDLHTPDFVQMAKSFGLHSEKVDSVPGFGPAFTRAMAVPGPSLLEIDMRAIGPMASAYGGTSRRPTR